MRAHLSRKKRFFIIIGLSLLIFTLYHLFFNERIDTVVKGRIYRSAQLSGNTLQKIIVEKGIRTIINLRGGLKDSEWYTREREISKKNNIRLYDIMLSPHELPEYSKLILLLDVLSRSERPILIHCRRGSDRTGMVSALALALEQDPPLSDIKKQFSWRYGVLPFYQSIGPYLFSKYEQWLDKTQRVHNKNNLVYWIENEYLDNQGNLEFWIDRINGMGVKDRKEKVMMNSNPKMVVIEGWAFDTRTKSPVDGLTITIDNRTSSKADFLYQRPDVAEYFGLGKEYSENFVVGWKARFETDTMSKGCHKITMKLVKGENIVEILTDYQFCF